ncbi:hypothetical protein D3C72_2404490 [compost metagenome]
MPVLPHRYGKPCSLPGSLVCKALSNTGLRFFQFGNWLLSSFFSAPPSICRAMKWLDGNTTSYPDLPVISLPSRVSLLS